MDLTDEGFLNPDRPTRVHRRHDRFEVSTACGGSLLWHKWQVSRAATPVTDLCPMCWPVDLLTHAST